MIPPRKSKIPPRKVPHVVLCDYNLPIGMVLQRVGNVVNWNRYEYVCELVNDCRSRFRRLTPIKRDYGPANGDTESSAAYISLSACCEPSFIIRIQDQNNFSTVNQNQNEHMNKKVKSAKGEKKEGKTAFILRHLLAKGSERKTKTEIVSLLRKQFPDVNEKTAKNTVNWCASAGCKKIGKESNHIAEETNSIPAKKVAVKKKSKAPAPKKAKAKKPTKKEKVSEVAAVEVTSESVGPDAV